MSNLKTLKNMRKTVILILSLLVNISVGAVLGSLCGSAGAGAVIGLTVPALAGAFIPKGVLPEGVFVEIWTGELVKALNARIRGTFLEGVPDYSQYSKADTIHLVDVGVEPEVLVNNTTYPIDVQELKDGDIAISLDKFQSRPTPVTDDELHAASYDKIASVKDRHADAIAAKKFTKAIHALAPSSDSAKTPVIMTSGPEDTATSRKKLTRADIIALKRKFDKLEVPLEGRRLVLCSDHVNDLLEEDQKFRDQYYNFQNGTIARMYGFQVFEYAGCPVFTSAGAKKAFGAQVSAGEFQASVAFYEKNIFKASGTTKMYFSEARTDPENQRNLVNYRHYFLALPKKTEAIGAIVSTHTGTSDGFDDGSEQDV